MSLPQPLQYQTNHVSRFSLILSFFIFATLLQGCAISQQPSSFSYDFGSLPKVQKQLAVNMAISVADISAPSTLDGNAMLYRLLYDNQQRLRPYAQHRWSMPPAQLLTQRLKSRIAAEGGTVLAEADGVADLPVLKIDLDEFSQAFASVSQSEAQITLRVSVIKKNRLIAQHYFATRTVSDSADASGGAKAMQTTADASITAILAWLQSLPLN